MTIPVTNLLPSSRDFDLPEGLDATLYVTAVDNAEAVLDLTGASIEWIMQPSSSDATGVVTKTVGAGITNDEPTTGIFQIAIDAADSAGLISSETSLEWYHRCTVTLSGRTYLLFKGTVTIKEVG